VHVEVLVSISATQYEAEEASLLGSDNDMSVSHAEDHANCKAARSTAESSRKQTDHARGARTKVMMLKLEKKDE
jgi:hypothetical protein